MKKLFIAVFLLITLVSTAQEQNFNYSNILVSDIITDIEDRFNVRFSYKSSLLINQKFSYKGKADLKVFLNFISEEKNLEFIYLDGENIVIKSSFDKSFDSNSLEEIVVVTEYLTAGFDQNKKDGSITMKPNKLGILPGLTEPDVLQSLQLLPGISSPTESASNIHIRGGTPDHNLILYDGIKIYHQGHLFGMISPFNPYIVESVDVFRSGTKAQYGDRISGIIDINSMTEVPDEFSGGTGANFLHADTYFKIPLQKDKIGLLFSVRRSINDVINLPTFNSLSDKVFQNTSVEIVNDLSVEEELTILDDTFNFFDVNTKLIFTLNEFNKISISGLLVDNSLNYANVDLDGYGTRDKLDLENKGISANWNFESKKDWDFSSVLKYSEFNSNYSFEEFQDMIIEDDASSTNFVKDFGFQLQGKYSLGTKTKLNMGYEYSKFDVSYTLNYNDNDPIVESESNTLTSHNLFVEAEYKTKSIYIRGGLRTSYFSDIEKTFLEPRFYLDYSVNEAFKLKASAEIKNQAISQLVDFEFNNLGVGNSVWVLADGDEIPVLNNKQFSFGFFYNRDGWKFDVESYYKKVKGLTSFTRGFSSALQTTEYASGNNTVFGIDVLLKKKINKFRTWLGYSYSKSDFEFPNLQSGKFPGNFDQRHVLSWSNTYKYKKIQFSFGWQFATGKPYSVATSFVDDEAIYNQQNNARLSNYHKLDLSAFYDFYLDTKSKVKARIGASIINLYNRDNEIEKTFNVNEDTAGNEFLVEQTNIGLGITPNLVFRIYF